MIFLERLALVQQLHARHAPAATRLDAVDVDVENLAGAGTPGEMRGDRVPPGVMRPHRAAAAIAAQDQRPAVQGADNQGDPAVRTAARRVGKEGLSTGRSWG